METSTTTEATNDETSTTSVPQSETDTTTQDSTTVTDETTETTTTTDNQQSIESLQDQVKRIEKALAKANREAKDYRLKASELEKFKQQVEAEKLTEQEKQELARKQLEQQLADTKKQYDDSVIEKQQIRVKHTVQLQAAKLGVEPDVAEKLLDWATIEYDDDGTPNNITTLLNNLVKTYPYLVKTNGRQAPTSGGATNPPRSSTSNATTTPDEYIKRMEQGNLKQDEYDRLPASVKTDIQKALMKARSGRR